MWFATMFSGTVDIPTASAPMKRRNLYSARVSKFGPGTATNTPRSRRIFRSSATFSASALNCLLYGSDISGNRGPSVSSFGPISGLSPRRLM